LKDNIALLKNWIINLENNIINNEILLLVFKKHLRYPKLNKRKFIKSFLSEIDSNTYHLVDINEIRNIEELQDYKDKKSIIIIGDGTISIDKIAHTNFEILLFFNPVQYYFSSKTRDELLEINEIKYPYRQIVVINKKDPFKIIYSDDYILISEYLNCLFFPHIVNRNFSLFQSFSVLKSDRFPYVSYGHLVNIFKIDIKLLIREMKLTARLAIAIYKVSTLKFDDNNTIIGTFFHKKLGIKSKTYKTSKEYYSQTLKVYDLKLAEKIIQSRAL